MARVNSVYKLFKTTGCDFVRIRGAIELPKSVADSLTKSVTFKAPEQPNAAFFASTYAGEKLEFLVVYAMIESRGRSKYDFGVSWFLDEGEARSSPKGFGKASRLLRRLGDEIGEIEVSTEAHFQYDIKKHPSIYLPIQMKSEGGILDEITGISGIKRTAGGKQMYRIAVSVHGEKLHHRIDFSPVVRLNDRNLARQLIRNAARISELALTETES